MSETQTWPMTARLPLGAASAPAPEASDGHDALCPGTRLDEFEVIRILGAGGFGIVYLALDHLLLRYVAIKEYMPAALAGRGKGAMVSVRSAALAETFAKGLESFFNEARLLANFDHPSLVKVFRFWKANGTAYMVMQYYPGRTLKEARLGMSASPDEAWLRAFVDPLLAALERLHREGVFHRDISPDNILLLPDGRPVLLDFGSARRVISDSTQSLTAILKPNFAPVEQYADEAGMRQGPWTDLYSLGATVHFMLTGEAPTPAVLRAVRDVLPALSAPEGAPFPGVPTEYLAAVDWTLALAPGDRPQSVASVRQAFNGEVVPPPPSPRHAAMPRPAPAAEADVDLDLDLAAVGTPPRMAPSSTQKTTTTALARRGSGPAKLAAFALTGLVALGWGAWALNPSAAVLLKAAGTAAGAASAVPSANAPPPLSARTAPQVAAKTLAQVPSTAATVPISRPTAVSAATAKASAPAMAPVTMQRQRPAKVLAASANVVSDASAPAPSPLSTLRQQPAEAPAANARVMPRSPKDACGDRNFFALAICVSRECQDPNWRAHPQCVEARRADEQRQRRMEQQ